ncbi:MAG TPA: quinoprotein relay system zinc metallohydrolase 2 [Rhodanobacteraceae bacterium]|nr:quinoprotein relay system zinc metallohydrolase 2 [Rhodanobacteraceae bacterium]
MRHVACALALASSAATAAPLEVREVAHGVFVHEGATLALDAPGHDDIANIGFVAGRRCVAVIDTGGSVRTGRALRESIAARTKLPVCYVINTHVHVDHVLGNAAFKADKPAFVGSATLGPAIEASRRYFVEHYPNDFDAPASGDQVIGPDTTVATTRDLDLGGRTLTLRAFPKAHTDSDMTVLVGDAGVLWTGDLLFVGRVPALDGSAKGWLAALGEIAKTHSRIVVPGHGPVSRDLAAALAPERRYLQALIDGVRKEIAEGKPIEDATGRVGASERASWQLFDTANAHNVSLVYRELEWE